MSQAQYERAITNLYEDDGIRSDLTDDEAHVLLGWGEARLAVVAAYELPDPQFDGWCGQLRRLLAALNQFIAKRDELLSGEEARLMRELQGLAQAAGHEIAQPELETFFQQQSALDNQAAISELLGLLKPGVAGDFSTAMAASATDSLPAVPPPAPPAWLPEVGASGIGEESE